MFEHQTVLLQQAVDALITDIDGLYIDGTFGRGGHSNLILERLSSNGILLVIDKDPEAIEWAKALGAKDNRIRIFHGSFADMGKWLNENMPDRKVNGILLDLGVSSPQLDDSTRGFSFNKDGPLDMRMDTSSGINAAEWIAKATEEEIANVIYIYGEERFSRRMARAIVKERQQKEIVSTLQLAEIIKQANPAWEKHKHPATRAFQGIRIFINKELDDLTAVLEIIPGLLCVGGRFVILSFHSLEDRLVKHFIRKQEKGDNFPRGLPVTQSQLSPSLKRVGKVVKGNKDKNDKNVRARSAVMRVAEKLCD